MILGNALPAALNVNSVGEAVCDPGHTNAQGATCHEGHVDNKYSYCTNMGEDKYANHIVEFDSSIPEHCVSKIIPKVV